MYKSYSVVKLIGDTNYDTRCQITCFCSASVCIPYHIHTRTSETVSCANSELPEHAKGASSPESL